MKRQAKTAQIHRFHDQVAVYIEGSGETLYLSKKMAYDIAAALSAASCDINTVGFADSELGTIVLAEVAL